MSLQGNGKFDHTNGKYLFINTFPQLLVNTTFVTSVLSTKHDVRWIYYLFPTFHFEELSGY